MLGQYSKELRGSINYAKYGRRLDYIYFLRINPMQRYDDIMCYFSFS